MIIQHNLSALNTQNKLKLVGKNKMAAMEKLSSGYRINRAADDSAGLAISEKMRGQIRGLDRAALNTEEGISLVKVADGGLNEVHSIIQRQRELMVQAANDTNTDTDRQAIEEEVTALGAELDRLFGQTEYNTINIFKGHDTIEPPGPMNPADPTSFDVPDPNPSFLKSTTITDNLSPVTSSVSSQKKYMTIADYNDITKNPTLLKKEAGDITIKQKDKTGPEIYDHVNTFPSGGPGDIEIWDGTRPDPLDDGTIVEASYTQKTRYSSTYHESESVVYTNELNHNTFLNESIYRETETDTIQHELKVKKSEYLTGFNYDDYTQVPDINSGMIDADGRIHFQNKSGELSFSDNISKLSVKVDGKTFPDIHSWPSITTNANGSSTTFLTNATNASGNTYQIRVTQNITMRGDHGYNVTYTIEDNDTNDNSFTSNGLHTYTFDYIRNNPTFCYDEYGKASGSLVAMDNLNLNSLEIIYNLNALTIPYNETTTIYSRTETYKKIFDDKTDTVYTPQYLDIQVGANSNQNVPIRLWDLSTAKIKGLVPNNISAFNAQDSLVHLDRILDKMSNIRAYYGAQSNRLEHAYANDTNESENLQASESKIRDADMSDEMVKFAKDNILEQAGQAMLTQANNMNQGILQLLQ